MESFGQVSTVNSLQTHTCTSKLTAYQGAHCRLFRLVVVVLIGSISWATLKVCCPARTTSNLPLTASSCSVSSTDHGVLRGPICDIDSWLWSVLPRLDHAGSNLRRALEVIALQPHDELWFHLTTNWRNALIWLLLALFLFVCVDIFALKDPSFCSTSAYL